MKIIFLDVDGVLNSKMYKATPVEGDTDNHNYIDLSRVKLVADIVNATDAKIVLSSSWRVDWDKSDDLCGNDAKYINKCLNKYGISIIDKTPYISLFTERRKEILIWLSNHYLEVESFVVLDDMNKGWEQLADRVVVTNPNGYGLEEEHVKKAIELLNTKVDFNNFI